MNVNLFKKSR